MASSTPSPPQSLTYPSHTSALFASNYVMFQSNAMPRVDPETEPLPDLTLPGHLANLISQLSSENRFPEPWTTYHSMHSEVGAIVNWLDQVEKDAGKEGKEFELPRQSGGEITTSYRPDVSKNETTRVLACPNCKILLDYFGIRDLNEEEYTEGSGNEVEIGLENIDVK